MVGLVKRSLDLLLPPVVARALRAAKRAVAPPAPPPLPYRLLGSLDELDAELDRALAALAVSCDAHFAALDSFQLAYPPPGALPPDPLAADYRAAQMAFYRAVARRTGYAAAECEQTPLDDDKRARPFPYYTRSTTVIGEQLQAVGFVVKALAAPPGARVLEFGAGFGRLTLEMAKSDLRVTAVEINPLYCDLIRECAARERAPVEVACAGMLDYRPAAPFDRVVFYECFHHCDDHTALVARLAELVAPGGAVLFAGEPVADDFPIPWGLRRDGRSLWCVRRHGWLELGFRTDYFVGLLERHGWAVEVRASRDVPWNRVFVARRR